MQSRHKLTRWLPPLGIASLLVPWRADALTMPTLQDIEIAGHVLAFQSDRLKGAITLGVVYNAASADSKAEADTIIRLIGNGLHVGDLVLTARAIPQTALGGNLDVGAWFVAGDVDQSLLRTVLAGRHLICLTRHIDEVAHGACTVSICSSPSVDLVISNANAAAADVHFATAFRMMVREL